jgi:hypothetical protein
MNKNKYLYRFYWDCGRSGELEGLFVATEEEVKDAIGRDVYFGEVLGKHSEVYGVLEEQDLDRLDISPDAVAEVSKFLGSDWSGFNPLDYIKTYCEECGDSMRVDEWSVEFREEFDKEMCYECYVEKGGKNDEI